jgi:class 3 adenylate cyclase
MSWNKSRSTERIEKTLASMPKIEVSPLPREMNLENVTLGKPKIVTGVHLYSAIANEAAHITEALTVGDHEAARPVLRAVHLWQREVSRIVGKDFDAAKIHFQGTRLHAIVYRPVGNMLEVVGRAAALAHAIELMTRKAFNDLLGEDARFEIAAGVAYGETLATRSGSKGDSELLFLGNAANHAAKVLKSDVRLRATADFVGLLASEEIDAETTLMDDSAYRVGMTLAAVEKAVERYKLDWSLDASRKRIETDLESIPLEAVGVGKATAPIDKERLSLANSKLNDATTLFGDVDGFTAMVEAASFSDVEQEVLMRNFHVMRAELRHIATQDFDTLRIQYQGDRIQALRHLPYDDEADRALQAVRLAAAWQTAMAETITTVLGDLSGLHLAVGLDTGPTLVSKLGEYGNRDMICLGKSVRRAAKIEQALAGDEIGMSATVRDLLPSRVAELFKWDQAKNCYVQAGVRYNDIVLAEEAEKLDAAKTTMKTSMGAGGGGSGYEHSSPRPRWHP